MIEIIVILALLIIYSIISTIGMIRGMKKTEFYEAQFEEIKKRIDNTYVQMKEVDTLGAFEADDDVGIVFEELRNLIEDLNQYTTENISEETNA